MKLRTKLWISFVCVIIVPIILFGVSSAVLVKYQLSVIKNSYGIDTRAEDFLPSNNRLYSQIMGRIQEELENRIKEDDMFFYNKRELEKFCSEEYDGFVNIAVLEDGLLYYSYNELSDKVLEDVCSEAECEDDSYAAVYFEEENVIMSRVFSRTIKDGTDIQIFTMVNSNETLPEVKKMIIQLVLLMIFAFIITASVLTVWIYRSILPPIFMLKEATARIKNGDLDSEIKSDSKDVFGELCNDFEQMRIRLKESAEEKIAFDNENRELISNISHDLKTPMTSIRGYVEGIMDGVADTPEKMQRYLKTIYNKTNDIQKLIEELTFYSKIDTNRVPYNFKKLNVNEFFADCVEEVKVELSAKNVSFNYSCAVAEDAEIIADSEQIKRVINNIISNSCKYFDKKDNRIEMRVRNEQEYIRIEIEDNGRGISKNDMPYIFDRFFRSDSSRNSSSGGSGIGLSIVKKIIEDHNGKVWAESIEGKGTVVYFIMKKYNEIVPDNINI